MAGDMFNKYHLRDVIKASKIKLSNHIDNLEITEIIDVNQIVAELKSEFSIVPLILKDAVPSEPKEITRRITNHWGELSSNGIFEINITIPFEGDKALFDCQASISTIIYFDESIRIHPQYISTTIVLTELDVDKFHKKVNKIISDISCNITKINEEIAPWNNGLENLIKELLEKRKGVVSKKYDFMEKIGLRVNPKSDEFMIPPTIAKKTIPTPITETSINIKKEHIPIIQQDVYNDIKDVLYNVGKAIERKPSLYIGKHEEDLRDIFLLFLETRYDSTSGVSEAFNKKGKTDILLKYAKDGTNIFVAECKVWKGQKKLHEGINQLLGYLTHRDSKTALIFFVDQKEFTSVVQTIKDEIIKHPQFKKHVKDTYEHSINYEFSLPDDSQKVIQMEVMLFHFPPIN